LNESTDTSCNPYNVAALIKMYPNPPLVQNVKLRLPFSISMTENAGSKSGAKSVTLCFKSTNDFAKPKPNTGAHTVAMPSTGGNNNLSAPSINAITTAVQLT
jgi:hypothetical protein